MCSNYRCLSLRFRGPSASCRIIENKRLQAVGEWNRSVIVMKGNHGEHWLNGAIVVQFELRTARMDSLVAASKYRVIPGFADHREGHIILQDHAEEVWFRSIKLRELKP